MKTIFDEYGPAIIAASVVFGLVVVATAIIGTDGSGIHGAFQDLVDGFLASTGLNG